MFIKFGTQSRENTLILNTLFGIDNLVPNFCPTMEVLSEFMKFGTKNKCSNIRINIHCLDSGQIAFWNWNMLSEIGIAVKSRRTVRKLQK